MGPDIESNSGLAARALAKRVKVSEATMSMTLQLLGLDTPIQERLLTLLEQPYVRHFGLRRLASMAALQPEQQLTVFTGFLNRWQKKSRFSEESRPEKL